MHSFFEVYEGVFAFDLFTPAQCDALKRKIAKQHDGKPPNSMNKYGAVLGGELRPLLARIVEKWIAPIAKAHYPEIRPLKKHPYAFSVEYEVGKQKSLAKHVDSSDVTLNICLDFEYAFSGGNVVFYEGRKQAFTYQHCWGRAIIHRGSFVHRAEPLTDGSRTNLILWCAQRAKRD